ncbi:MAG: CBS domain-containing protein [Methanomassiliicoccales archaeon]|jgi:CBS domain-containing protein|nr:CBS domain-containing protein [Methanomassiliicoccales archaeon]MDD1756711.1 CBS domain-containing protein [Methanomassiliicoccales archaeon]
MLPGKRLDELRVGDLGRLVDRMPPTLQKSATLGQALEAIDSDPFSRKAYVIDVEGNLVGVVTPGSIIKLMLDRARSREDKAKPLADLAEDVLEEGVEKAMRMPFPIKTSTSLAEALSILQENHLTGAPVVDEDYKLVGELVALELLKTLTPASSTKA